MKRLPLYCAVSLALLAAAGCAPAPKDATEATEAATRFEKESLSLAQLGIETAAESENADRLSLTGTLQADPAATAIVTARVEGKIIRLFPAVGDRVAAGHVVAIVESEKLHEAQLNHALSLKRLEAAEADLRRRRKLAGFGAYGQPGIEEARRVETEAQAALERAQGEVRTAEAARAEATSRLAALEAAVEQAKSAAGLAQSQRELAQKQTQRSERLLAERLVSRQEHEEALAQLAKARAEGERAEADVRAAQARHAEGQAGIESARIRQEVARKTEESARAQLLLARQARSRGEAIYRGGYLTSREVAEAEAAVAQAKVSVEGALDDVRLLGGQPGDNHSIPVPAPLSGQILERKATLGQTVQAGEPILTLVNARTLFAQLALFPADLHRVRPGQAASLRIAGQSALGRVERIGDAADERTRAVQVQVRVDNASGRLRPGLPVTAVLAGAAQRVVLVPSGAVQTVEGKTAVFVPGEKSGEFIPRAVQAGVTQDGKTAILAGLKPGEKYVAKNAFLVKSQAMKGELGEE